MVIAATVFSHWLLDLLVHRIDLPVLPGNAGNLPLLGLSLWQWPALSIGLETALILLGALLYARSALSRAELSKEQPAGSNRRRAVWAGTALSALLILSLVTDVIGIG